MSTIAAGGSSSPDSPSGSSTSSSKQRHTSFSKNLPDDKRKRKLELNRIASRESRKRKKRRLEELQRSVLYLTHENHQLREQNELLRQMLVGRLPILEQATGAEGAAPSGEQQPEQLPQQQELAALLTTSKEEVTDAVALPAPIGSAALGEQAPSVTNGHHPPQTP